MITLLSILRTRSIYIIGSGLSGIAAATALVARGFRPTILDAGVGPDAGSAALKARLAAVEPETWSATDLQELKRIGPATPTGIPRKLHFGSEFAYRDADASTAPAFEGASILRTFARGGFSNVWGAVIQPWDPGEFACWPVAYADIERHYRAVRGMLGSSTALPSSQARALHDDLNKHRSDLDAQGVRFDYASVAVGTAEASGQGCRHCGLCLYGCPYDAMFSASAQLSRLVAQGSVSYEPNVVVDRISRDANGLTLEARSTSDSGTRTFHGESVFLAAGLLETTRMILNSTNYSGSAIAAKQSEIFTVPLLRYRRAPGISTERLHTLCQVMIEIQDKAICSYPVQLQLYGYNDMYPEMLARRAGPVAEFIQPLIRNTAERLVVAFGYLHSRVSSRVWIRRTDSGNGSLRVEGEVRSDRDRVGYGVLRKLSRLQRCFQAMPIPFQLRFDRPGGGHRSGGCFPMKRLPAGLETDEWGRFPDFPGLHVVDSTVLPALPAAPLAFTVMANAHRIASECPLPDAA